MTRLKRSVYNVRRRQPMKSIGRFVEARRRIRADGNLIRKQDANGTVTSYAYDSLHRLTSRSFAVASGVAATPNVELDYDSDPTGRTTYNAVGRLTRVWNGQVELSFNLYDPMGRAQVLDTSVGGATYHTNLSFDLIGYPTWELLPSGRQLYLTDDVEGRPRWIGDGQYGSVSYVAARYYNAAGQPDDEYLGNGLLQSWHHDVRGRLIKVDVEDPAHPDYSNWRMDLDINYLPDSDVAGLVDNLGGSGQNQTYTYDALNRLRQWTTSAGLSCGFAIDRYGNLSLDATKSSSSGCPLPSLNFTAANQIQGRIYDADGNLLSDGVGQSWSWNGENQLAAYQVTSPTQSAQYLYDGLGRRVEKIADGVTTLYLRTALGPVADEATGPTWTDSVNVPGAERVAVIRGPADGSPGTAATVAWLHADQVGTTRVLTDQNGNNLVQCNQNSYYAQGSLLTYAPFGAELDCTQAQTDYKFTGKPRDEESGLDDFGARYHASGLGRWMTPDDGSDQEPGGPQSWNLYSYVRNNPVSHLDPDGHTCVTTDNGTTADDMDGKGCTQLNDADQVVNVSAGLSTADLVGDSVVDQSAGRWFVGFGNLILNGKASGLRDMAAGMVIGALAIAGAGEGRAGEEPTTIGPDLRWGDPATLQRHFENHGGDFVAKTAGQYAAMAQKFALRTDTQVKVDERGVVRIWDPETRTFGSYNPDGSTRTFFKATSPTYFDRQPGQRIR